MTKQDAQKVKAYLKNREFDGQDYKFTFSAKTETLHIRIASYVDRRKLDCAELIKNAYEQREKLVEEINQKFDCLLAEKNDKRYSGYINDICVIVK